MWETVERPGYFGSKRDQKHVEYDKRYGEGEWRLAWQVGDHFFDREVMYMLYEDSYYFFLKDHKEVLDELASTALDVFDDAESNIHSGLDYLIQETNRTHVQDIAIRRALKRLGRDFEGTDLLQIRDADGVHSLSLTLSPGRIPFHESQWIIKPEIEGWWEKGSVESFYQSNKVLQKRAFRFSKTQDSV